MKRISRYIFLFLAAVTVASLIFLAGSAMAQEAGQPEFKAPELKALTEKLPAVFAKKRPESVADLKAIQDHVDTLVQRVTPSVVSVRIGNASGSGVIVTRDGYVLTAGHVSGTPGRDVTVIFHNGKTAKGKTLGGNHGIDSGLIKITAPGEYPAAEMGDSAAAKADQWCLVIAHPGGFKQGRAPVVRLGRMLNNGKTTLTTDCALVGGDSGGPLFDMHGRVIGINSRIGGTMTANMHVPVNPFRDSWESIAKGEVVGGKGGPYIGVVTLPDVEGCVIKTVTPGSPAAKAGLQANDVIRKFDGKEIAAAMELVMLVQARKVGDQVVLEILRGDDRLSIKIEIGKR